MFSNNGILAKVFLLSFVFLFLPLSGCGKKELKKQETTQVIPVRVMRVELLDLNETLDYAGDVKAQDEAIVYPKVGGKIIEKVKEDGSPIVKGEVVVFIDRDEIGLKFKKAPVESPLNGTVGRVYVDIGENVSPQTPVALVINMDKVKITLDIPEKYLSRLSLDRQAKVFVDAEPGREFKGRVAKISPVLDLATRSAPIEITVDNTEHVLKSGMFAKVKLIIQDHPRVPVIIKEALLGHEPDLFVYVIENNKAIMRKVAIGLRQGPYCEVKEGLKEDDRVVTIGQERLYDNAWVAAEEEK